MGWIFATCMAAGLPAARTGKVCGPQLGPLDADVSGPPLQVWQRAAGVVMRDTSSDAVGCSSSAPGSQALCTCITLAAPVPHAPARPAMELPARGKCVGPRVRACCSSRVVLVLE